MIEEGIEKLHGLHHTAMTMHQRFTMFAQASIFRRGRGKRNPFLIKTRSQTMNPHILESLVNQLQNQSQWSVRGMPFLGRGRGRGRARGGLRRSGSEGSIRSMPGLRRVRSNSFSNMGQNTKNQNWRRSNGNLSMNGSVFNGGGSVHSEGFQRLRGRGGVRGRGRGRGRPLRGRMHLGRVARINGVQPGPQRGLQRLRGPRGTGRRGVRRVRGAPGGRGRGMPHKQPPKPVPTKEELDQQLEQYMAGTKAALDKELDEYMRTAMDFE